MHGVETNRSIACNKIYFGQDTGIVIRSPLYVKWKDLLRSISIKRRPPAAGKKEGISGNTILIALDGYVSLIAAMHDWSGTCCVPSFASGISTEQSSTANIHAPKEG